MVNLIKLIDCLVRINCLKLGVNRYILLDIWTYTRYFFELGNEEIEFVIFEMCIFIKLSLGKGSSITLIFTIKQLLMVRIQMKH